MNKKKTLASALAIFLGISCFGGCFPFGETSSSSSSSSLEEAESDLLYESADKKVTKLTAGKEIEIAIGKEIEDNNFLTVNLLTDCNLIGYIHYTKTAEPAIAHKEKIYIEAGSTEFSMFLDAFRIGAFGAYEKTVEKITLRNVNETTGNVRVNWIDVSDRVYDNQEMLYTQNEHLKIGASLAAGGALCHVESLDRSVVEYVDDEGIVRIEQGLDQTTIANAKGEVVTDEVNFVNVHDLGRIVQQSYYAFVGEQDGYAPDDEIVYPGDLRYNPVQAGSAGDKQSQIIDYRVGEEEIYVKCRPQDWFLDNTQSDSYMESTYTFGGDGTLRVSNRFVNFSEFENMDTVYYGTQENPAIYLVQPLNYFYCETRNGEIFDPNLQNAMETPSINSDAQKPDTGYHYRLHKAELLNEWFAFVNDKKFGVGVYMPKVDQLVASRGWTSNSSELIHNQSYRADIYDVTAKYVPSMCVGNYNYCSPDVVRRMVDFVPYEYTFAMYVGTVSEMSAVFGRLKNNNAIPNEGIEVWETREF